MRTGENFYEELTAYPPSRVTWSPYQLYNSFPKSRPAAERAKKALTQEVFALQDLKRANHRDPLVERMINQVYIDGPIAERMERIEELKKYIALCKFKRGDSRTAYAERVARAKAVPLSTYLKIGRGGFASCPLHTDHTPSLKVYADNTWHCHSCGTGNDVIDLVRRLHNCSFLEAVNKLVP